MERQRHKGCVSARTEVSPSDEEAMEDSSRTRSLRSVRSSLDSRVVAACKGRRIARDRGYIHVDVYAAAAATSSKTRALYSVKRGGGTTVPCLFLSQPRGMVCVLTSSHLTDLILILIVVFSYFLCRFWLLALFDPSCHGHPSYPFFTVSSCLRTRWVALNNTIDM